jgi:hypothetical protein
LLRRDALVPRQLDHVHAERRAQQALRLSEDEFDQPRVRGAQYALYDFGAPDLRA